MLDKKLPFIHRKNLNEMKRNENYNEIIPKIISCSKLYSIHDDNVNNLRKQVKNIKDQNDRKIIGSKSIMEDN